MKSIYVTFFNIFVVIISHVIAFKWLNDYALTTGACGMGVALIGGGIPLLFSFVCSSIIVFFITKIHKETYLSVTVWYIVWGIFWHLLIAFFAESYLCMLLTIPYLLFLGESLYLKFSLEKE